MKKSLLKTAVAFTASLTLALASNGADIDFDTEDLFGISPTKPEAVFDTSSVIPAVNILTGTKSAYTFDGENAKGYFYNADKKTAYQYKFGIAEETSGKAFAIKLDTNIYNSVYGTSGEYSYSSLTADFTKAIDRPVHIFYQTKGKGQNGFLLSAGSTHMNLGTVTDGAWNTVSTNNASVFDGTMRSLRLQYASRVPDCSETQLFDNLALFPFYKITYNAEYPDGTSGKDVVRYTFDASNLAILSDGTFTGFPESYTIEDVNIGYIGYNLVGWTTTEGANTPMAEIDLKNGDTELYPIWETATPTNVKIYLTPDRTKVIEESLYHGEELKLPTYTELAAVSPKGKYPTGYTINGKHYAPGATIIVPKADTFEISVDYANTLHEEYGELVLYEDFESVAEDTQIYNPATGEDKPLSISYVNPEWSKNPNHFRIQFGDYADYTYVTADNTGNHVLATRKRIAAESWPQFLITNSAGTTPEGDYTLIIDFAVPEEHIPNVNGIEMRLFYTGTDFEQIGGKYASTDVGTWKKLSISLPIQAGSAKEAITKFQIFAYTNHESDKTTFYVDNIALYCKGASAEFDVTDSYTHKVFFKPGEPFTLPYLYEMYDKLPEGMTLAGFRFDGKLYQPGESFETSKNVNKYEFEAVWEDTVYGLKFDIGGANGTLPEIYVTDGDTVTLPEAVKHPYAALVGWKAYGSDTIYAPGDEFTFTRENEKLNLDGTNRLVFTAVYNKADNVKAGFEYNFKQESGQFAGALPGDLEYIKIAYGAGIIPASANFDTDASVTLSDLVKIGERLYYRSKNEASYFETDAERLADMVQNGICESIRNLDKNATYADAAIVLANALPYSSYPEITFSVKVSGLEIGDKGYFEALKLVRAGILPESTDFTKDISFGELVEAVAKTVQPSLRETETKRKLWLLGDSLTDKTTIGWPTKLDAYLDGNLEMVNYGVGGWDTSHYLDMNNYSHQNYLDVLRRVQPGDYVIIALGTNDSTLWGRGHMAFETSRDNFYKYASQVLSEGGIPVFVCPVGRNQTDSNGKYVESDPDIIRCMNAVNEVYGAGISIINFKEVSFDRLGKMTADERLEIYRDSVHYTQNGAYVVAGWFDELVTESGDAKLAGLASHMNEVSFDFENEENIFEFETPETEKVTSVRTETPAGIRFRANIGKSVRGIDADVAEYGFIVTRKALLGDKELTHDCGVTYVTGTSYNNVKKTDTIYALDSETGDVTFTAVLIGTPETKEGYTSEFVVRSYVKVGASYFYGDTHSDSIYEAAKRLGETDSEYIKNVIKVCEG